VHPVRNYRPLVVLVIKTLMNILFDVDGTLVQHGTGDDIPGEPFPTMKKLLLSYLDDGDTIHLFTARACLPEQIPVLQAWSLKHFGVALHITNQKDFSTGIIYDDRAIQVRANTGTLVTGSESLALTYAELDCLEQTLRLYHSMALSGERPSIEAESHYQQALAILSFPYTKRHV